MMTDPDQEPTDPQEAYNEDVAAEVARLQAYRRSLEEEFKGLDADDPEASKLARNKLLELTPDAGETIAYLLLHSDSDTVRSNLAKFVFQEAMKAASQTKDGDVLTDLLKSMQKAEDKASSSGNK